MEKLELIEKDELEGKQFWWISKPAKNGDIGIKADFDFQTEDVTLYEEDKNGKIHNWVLLGFSELKQIMKIINSEEA